MRFYDSASATIREFEPVVPGEARIYYCGATVQGEPHLGHIRSALVFDQLSRWMRYRGLKVTTVRNVTDIDDKILAKSADSMEPGLRVSSRMSSGGRSRTVLRRFLLRRMRRWVLIRRPMSRARPVIFRRCLL